MKFFFLAIATVWLVACTTADQDHSPLDEAAGLPGPFLGLSPTDTPAIVLPGFISTQLGEYNGTFNPDGTEFYYTISVQGYNRIVFSTLQKDGGWSTPAFASFSAPYEEWDPLFSPDGQQLWYSSHRPVDVSGNSDICNIWRVNRTDDGWGEPEYVALPGPRKGNYYSSVTTSGTIYFNIWATGNLFRGIAADTGYRVEPVSEVIESPAGDGDPFVAPDESYLIWRSYRNGGFGDGDLWISFQNEGNWTAPQNLGEPINSPYHEMCPYVTVDGKLFIFASNRFQSDYYTDPPKTVGQIMSKFNSMDNGQQNIYVMSASFIEDLRKRAIH